MAAAMRRCRCQRVPHALHSAVAEMLRHLLALTPATECHIDGYYPRGTDHCVMVIKDEHERILITYEAASENGEEAKQFLHALIGFRGLRLHRGPSSAMPF
jgi:hypothetical protein